MLAVGIVLGGCGAPRGATAGPSEPGATAATPDEPVSVPASAPPAAKPEPTAAPAAEPAPPAKPEPPALKPFALAEYKLPLVIDLPSDAKLEASASKDKLGGVNIDATNVELRVMRADAKLASVATAKATLQKLAYKPVTKFVKEEANLLVYERGAADNLGFVLLVKEGGVLYACQQSDGAKSEAELEQAIAACRSLKKAP